MRIEAQELESGRKFSAEAPWLDEGIVDRLFNTFEQSAGDLKSWINRLNISADAKAILFNIGQATIRVGGLVVRIGRKILEVIHSVVREYPRTTFGLIFGAVVGTLVASIPVIGFLIGPMFKALAMVAGMTLGYLQDIQDKSLMRRIKEASLAFENLRTK